MKPLLLLLLAIFACPEIVHSQDVPSGIKYIEIPSNVSREDIESGEPDVLRAARRSMLDALSAESGAAAKSIGSGTLPIGAYPDVIIYTKNGIPILPDMERVSRDKEYGPIYPGPPEENELTFTFVPEDEPWTQEEISAIQDCLGNTYPMVKEMFGPPFFNLTVNVIKESDTSYPGSYTASTNEMTLKQSGDCDIITHETAHAFHDDFLVTSNIFSEGFARAAEVEIITSLGDTSYYLYAHGYDFDVHYEQLNVPAVSSTWGIFNLLSILSLLRYNNSGYAWWKVYQEDNNFFKNFNNDYFDAATENNSIRGSYSTVKSIALENMPSSVEGKNTEEWFASQHVLNKAKYIGYHFVSHCRSVAKYDGELSVRLFSCDETGDESPAALQPFTVNFFNTSENLIATATGETYTTGYRSITPISDYLPAGYSGRVRAELRADTPGEDASQRIYFNWRNGGCIEDGFFGVITNRNSGTVKITPVDAPGSAATVNVANGGFVATAFTSMKGKFTLEYSGPNGEGASVTVIKDASPYFIQMTSSEFPPSTPALLTPLDGTTTNDPTPAFSWEHTAGLDGTYSIQIATSTAFTHYIYDVTSVSTNTFTPGDRLSIGDYFWRVKAANSGGESAFQSTPFSFTVIDTSPPEQLRWSPRKGMAIDSTSINISIYLDEAGDCRWSLSDQSYDDMTEDCVGDGTTWQNCPATGLASGVEIVYISCSDTYGNKDTESTNEHVNYVITVPINSFFVHSGWNLVGISKQGASLAPQTALGSDMGIVGFADSSMEDLSREDSISMSAGSGYWIYSGVDLGVIDAGGTEISEDTFAIDLSAGWNIFSNPFTEAIAWSDDNASLTCGGAAEEIVTVYSYKDGAGYSGITPNTGLELTPWTGYWIRVGETCSLSLSK